MKKRRMKVELNPYVWEQLEAWAKADGMPMKEFMEQVLSQGCYGELSESRLLPTLPETLYKKLQKQAEESNLRIGTVVRDRVHNYLGERKAAELLDNNILTVGANDHDDHETQ